jgi:hypothetical protein
VSEPGRDGDSDLPLLFVVAILESDGDACLAGDYNHTVELLLEFGMISSEIVLRSLCAVRSRGNGEADSCRQHVTVSSF